jgi:hypothetical protein
MRDVDRLTPDQIMNNLSLALAEARRRNQDLIETTGDPQDKVLSPNQRTALYDELARAASIPSQMSQAHNEAMHYKVEIVKYSPFRAKYEAMSERLAALIPQAGDDQPRIDCINFCLSYLTYYACPKCFKVEANPATGRVENTERLVPYCGCGNRNKEMLSPGFPAEYPVTIPINRREISTPAEQARIRPYATRSLLIEIDASTPGPAFDFSLDIVRDSSTPPYLVCIDHIKRAEKKLRDVYFAAQPTVEEMLEPPKVETFKVAVSMEPDSFAASA